MQVLKPNRVMQSLLLATLMLAPGFLALVPSSAAQTANACIADIAELSTSPSLYIDAGQTFSLVVRTVNTGQADGAPPTTLKARLKIEAHYQNGTLAGQLLGTADSGDFSPPFTYSRSFTPNATYQGFINFTAHLLPGGPNVGGVHTDSCLIDQDSQSACDTAGTAAAIEPTCEWWGAYAGDRPDLIPVSIGFIQHLSDEDTAGAAHPWVPFRHNYTRYPEVTGTCAEQSEATAEFQPGRMHFNVTVRNNGTAPFAAPNTTAGDPLQNLTLRVRVLDNGEPLGTVNMQVAADKNGGLGTGLITGLNYSMLNKAGVRNITIQLDPGTPSAPNGRVPERDETNNGWSSPTDPDAPGFFAVRAPDLTGTLDVRVVGKRIEGDWKVRNDGAAKAGKNETAAGASTALEICASRTGDHFNARIYIDREDDAHLLKQANLTLEANVESTSLPSFESGELGAGNHSVILVTGWNNTINDYNRSNDRVYFNFSFPDEQDPALADLAFPAAARAGAAVNISGNVSDDSDFSLPASGGKVFIDLTLPNGTAQSLEVPRAPVSGYAGAADAGKVKWWLNRTYDQDGTYAFRVRAVDGAGRTALLPAVDLEPFTFTLSEFSKNVQDVQARVCARNATAENASVAAETCAVGHVHYVPTPAATLQEPTASTTAPGNFLVLTFKVPPGATGLLNESRNVSRKTVQLWDPDGEVMGNFTVAPVCFNMAANGTEVDCITEQNVVPEQGVVVPSVSEETCTPTSTNCFNFTFRLRIGIAYVANNTAGLNAATCNTSPGTDATRLFTPGPHNLTLWVGDVSPPPCKYRSHGFNGTQPFAGTLYTFEFWAPPNATVRNAALAGATNGQVRALDDAVFRADLTDDIRIKQAVVLVRDASEAVVASVNMSATSISNPATLNGTYQAVVSTGLGGILDRAGSYRWIVGVKDANHTWSFGKSGGGTCVPYIQGCDPWANAFSMSVADQRDPSVSNETTAFPGGTASDQFQVGSGLIVKADVDDDTRLQVQAVVQNGTTGTELFRVNMTRLAGTLYASENITTGPGGRLAEGSYRFFVVAQDSAGKTRQTLPRSFLVAADLAPSFRALTPVDDGFGRPNGRVSVDVIDALHGVDAASIELRVGYDGNASSAPASVDKTEIRADDVVIGYRASFALPITLAHGTRVSVEVSAADGGGLSGSRTWNFTVDGLAPRSTLACSPSYPASCGADGGAPAVRGSTVFNVTALDPDPAGKARSGVARVEVSFEAAGQSFPPRTATADEMPLSFTLGALGGADGVYKVRVRATDQAGNAEPDRTYDVILDSRGPEVQNVLVTPTPSGWNVTATITDLAADVKSARLHYRTDATRYESVAMERLQDTRFWSANMPGARRGATVHYYLEATDFLDNTATNGTSANPLSFRSENHPPQLSVLSPREGEQVGGALTVRWQTSDIDGDPVTVAISYRRAGDAELVRVPLSSEEQGQRFKVIDTSRLVAAGYVLRIDASDNQAFNNRTTRQVNFTVAGEDSGPLRPRIDKPTIAPGDIITVSVEIVRDVRGVEATLLRDGQVIATQEMEQDPPGTTTWVAAFRIQDAGVYEVEVRGEYADGTPFTIKAARTVTVQGGLLGAGQLDHAIILVLGLSVIGVGLVGMRRRGWL